MQSEVVENINTNKPTTNKFNIFKLFKNFFMEIIYFIKSFIKGIISIFDFIITIFVTFFSYIYFGIKNIFLFLWKWGLMFIFTEIYSMFKAVAQGSWYILATIFSDIPRFIFKSISKFIHNISLRVNKFFLSIKDKFRNSDKSYSNIIKDYVKNKYDNLSIVKEARERKEANLNILVVSQSGADAEKNEVKQTYKYLVRNKEGKLITGYFAALSRLDVYSYLIDEGYTVYEIETSKMINFLHAESSSLKRKIKNKDLVFWLTQLSTYIKSGVPLAEAVKIIAKQDKRRRYKGVYDSVIYELTMGNSFSDSLKAQGNVFPQLLINMIKSAELIGNIESTLDDMSAYYQEVEDTKKAIISAISYPVIILVFAIAVVIFLLVYIIPQFVSVYESIDAELPEITKITLSISNYLTSNYQRILIIILSVILLLSFMYKNLRAFKQMVQTIIMKIPVIGKIIIYKELSIFARTFSDLNKNNVLLTDSIDILRKITNNEIYRNIMYRTLNNLLKGEKMSASFKDHWAIPDIAYHMISTGESTGELSDMLGKVADYYQKQQKNMISQIKTFIEPILICFLAVAVGFIIISVILPMLEVSSNI